MNPEEAQKKTLQVDPSLPALLSTKSFLVDLKPKETVGTKFF